MASGNLELAVGTSADFPRQIVGKGGKPANEFVATDPIESVVWTGGLQRQLLAPTTAWTDAATASYVVSFNDADTAGWSTGDYRLQTFVTRSGRKVRVGDVPIILVATPGTEAIPRVYCSYQNMTDYAPLLDSINDRERDESGFLRQRKLARERLEQAIQHAYRLTGGLNLHIFGNPVPTWGPTLTGGNNKWLQDWLDQDKLMVAPPRLVVEITAKYAIGLVLQRQLIGASGAKNEYRDMASWFLREASSLLKCYTAEIDYNDDGLAEVTIECGEIRVLRG